MSKKKVGQADRVLDYIKTVGSITRAQAFEHLGVANLPAVISELRNKFGVDIITDTVPTVNRYNEKCSYAKYRLSEENKREN